MFTTPQSSSMQSRLPFVARLLAIAAISFGLSAPSIARATTYDANDLTIAATSGDTEQTASSSEASGGNFLRYKSNGVGDFITLDVNVPATQTYQVTVRYNKYVWGGICQLTINGSNQGSAEDLYNADYGFAEIDLGTASIEAGTRAFKFTATGKNSGSSGHHIGIDTITLTPVNVPSIYDANDLTIAATSGDTEQTASSSEASGGNFLRYKSNGVGDFITLDVNVPATQTYQVTVRYNKYVWGGICQLTINGSNQGSAEDLYNADYGFAEIDLGTASIEAGTRAFKFTATGKNSSSSGYHIGIDTITLTPTIGGDTTPPAVSITDPLDSTTVSGTAVNVAAAAWDNVGVAGVQLKLNGVNLGPEDTISPYAITWDTTSESNAMHVLTGTARDDAGNITTSPGVLVTVHNPAERILNYIADFESGAVQGKDSTTDGFFVHTLPINQTGSTSISSNSGGFGPTSQTDLRVVTSARPPTNGNGAAPETVTPRRGEFFLEDSIHYNKDYTELNNGLPKARSKLNWTGEHAELEFDVEAWYGFSLFLPSNYEIETTGKRIGLWRLNTNASGTQISLQINNGGQGGASDRWNVLHQVNASSVTEGGSQVTYHDLGDVSDDFGMWTDFVIRYRGNPFSTTTNASSISGGKDQVYEGNRGILQVWKTTGAVDANGNRAFTRFINIENAPTGLVPSASLPINSAHQLYKGNWQTASTSVQGPIWMARDCIYQGEAIMHGTSFSDVNSGQLQMP